MSLHDGGWATQINAGLTAYEDAHGDGALPGLACARARESLRQQLIDSIHRVEFIRTIAGRPVSEQRIDPDSDLFDPLKAAIFAHHNGDTDEAFWLVFLATHCGRNRRTGWRLASELYRGNGFHERWTWQRIAQGGFRVWLAAHGNQLRGKFGNHRKYESLRDDAPRPTGAVVESYVTWIKPPRTHKRLIEETRARVGTDSGAIFDHLYRSMSRVLSFGRTARFDYLTMIGKLGFADIEPNSPYIEKATGPYRGGQLLFGGRVDAKLSRDEIRTKIVRLGADLNLGMQVMEDALCNWQKNPTRYVHFRG